MQPERARRHSSRKCKQASCAVAGPQQLAASCITKAHCYHVSMKPPFSKLPHVGTTIFTTMSALASEVGAVNLGQGFPDFACDPRLIDMMNDAMRAGHNQYPPMAGLLALREAVAEKIAALYGTITTPRTTSPLPLELPKPSRPRSRQSCTQATK